MAETPAAKVLGIGPEYNAFLYATIGVDPNGSALSVLSAMARMELDPWQEAAALSRLSGKAAARRLASLIVALPVKPSASSEPVMTAERLIKLLPRPATAARPLYKTLFATTGITPSRKVLFVLAILVALAIAPLWSLLQRPTSAPPAPAHSSGITATPNK